MKITVNGEDRELEDGLTLGELLRRWELSAGRLACERNRDIVPRAAYDETVLKDGDSLEIVQMIGGG